MERHSFIVTLVTLAFLFGTPLAHADINDLAGIGNAAVIVMNPAHPRPGDTVHLSVESGLISIADSDVVWYKNGAQLLGGQGISKVDVAAGTLGSETAVRVTITAADGTTAEARASIIPAEVDVLMSADTLTPPFYLGRALTSGGATVRLWAIARLKKPGSAFISPKDTVYTWRQDGQVIGSASGRGRESLTIPAPFPKSTSVISVEAHDIGETVNGTGSIAVSSIDPVVRAYEDHPLIGIRYGNALSSQVQTADNEFTLAVMPFFAGVRTADDSLLRYDWKVNGTAVQTTGSGQNEITLGGNRGSTREEQARVTVELSHATNLFLDGSGAWHVTLKGASSLNLFNSGTDQ